MSLSYLEIQRVVREVFKKLVGQRVRKVFQLDEETVALELRNPKFLVLSIHPRLARIHSAKKIKKWGKTPAFGAFLRKHLTGLVLGSIETVGQDRVVKITFGYPSKWSLIVEMIGNNGDMVVLDDHDIVTCLLQNSKPHSRKTPGSSYSPPPSPTEEVLRREKDRFVDILGSADAHVEEIYSKRIRELEVAEKNKDLVKALRRKIKFIRRRMDRLQEDLEKAEKTQEFKKFGDLLLANVYNIEAASQMVVLEDLFSEAEKIEIRLDPQKSVTANAQRYYDSYRRGKKTKEMAGKKLQQGRREIHLFKGLLEEALGTLSFQRLEEIEKEAFPLRLRKPKVKRKKPEKRKPYREFLSKTGKKIFVGKSARDNQELTFHVARGRDLWLHVTERAGPHVIVRLKKGEGVDGETLLDAASLAVYYTLHSRKGSAEVVYALKKYIRPIKGAPGKVTHSHSKVLNYRMEPVRLERLLKSKIVV